MSSTDKPGDLIGLPTGAEAAARDTDLIGLPTGYDAAGPAGGGSGVVPAVTANDFEIVRELGRGGMGVAHLARHRRVRTRWFAVKSLRPDRTADAGFLKRFHREAGVLNGLRHAHVIVLHGASRAGEPPAMVLEYVAGPDPADPGRHPDWRGEWPNPPQTLADLAARKGKMTTGLVAEVGVMLAGALQAVHDRGLVHRDVKPQNVLLDRDGHPVLADFGLARDVDPEALRLTGSMDNLGTPFYVAPEVLRDPAAAAPPADQYSLAVTLYAAATGGDPTVLRPGDVDPRLWAVLNRALDKNPDARYPSAAALGAALAPLRPVAPPPTGAFDPLRVACPYCPALNRDGDLRCAGCGKSITGPCLECGADMSLTRPACGKCGNVQAEVMKAREAEASTRFAAAAAARSDGRFVEAFDALRPVAAWTNPRLAGFAHRAEAELKEIEEEQGGWRKKALLAVKAVWPDYTVGRMDGLAARFAEIPREMWLPRMARMTADAEGAEERARTGAARLAEALRGLHAEAYVTSPEDAAARAGVRDRFAEFARRVPHHTQDAFPAKIAVGAAEERYPRVAVLTHLIESRKWVRRTRPFNGESIPPCAEPLDKLDVWGFQLPVPDSPNAPPAETAIPATEVVIDCPGCKTARSVVCPGCGGRKLVQCHTCRGARALDCAECAGKGRQRWTKEVPDFRPCGRCRGSGKDSGWKCDNCDGTGREKYKREETYTVPCEACHERGKVVCQTCVSLGDLPCPGCRATGQITCPACAGTARAVEFAVVVQSFQAQTVNTAPAPRGDIPPDVFALVRPDKAYQFTWTAASPPLTPFGRAADAGGPSEFVDRVQAILGVPTLTADTRLARQFLTVSTATVLHFEYGYRNDRYECWAAGGAVWGPENPVTDELKDKVRVATTGDVSRRAAAGLLREVREMADADPWCRAALDYVRRDIRNDLWEWSKTAWTDGKVYTVGCGAATLAVGVLAVALGVVLRDATPAAVGILAGLVGFIILMTGLSKSR